jgi:hypothetical protein
MSGRRCDEDLYYYNPLSYGAGADDNRMFSFT